MPSCGFMDITAQNGSVQDDWIASIAQKRQHLLSVLQEGTLDVRFDVNPTRCFSFMKVLCNLKCWLHNSSKGQTQNLFLGFFLDKPSRVPKTPFQPPDCLQTPSHPWPSRSSHHCYHQHQTLRKRQQLWLRWFFLGKKIRCPCASMFK